MEIVCYFRLQGNHTRRYQCPLPWIWISSSAKLVVRAVEVAIAGVVVCSTWAVACNLNTAWLIYVAASMLVVVSVGVMAERCDAGKMLCVAYACAIADLSTPFHTSHRTPWLFEPLWAYFSLSSLLENQIFSNWFTKACSKACYMHTKQNICRWRSYDWETDYRSLYIANRCLHIDARCVLKMVSQMWYESHGIW